MLHIEKFSIKNVILLNKGRVIASIQLERDIINLSAWMKMCCVAAVERRGEDGAEGGWCGCETDSCCDWGWGWGESSLLLVDYVFVL